MKSVASSVQSTVVSPAESGIGTARCVRLFLRTEEHLNDVRVLYSPCYAEGISKISSEPLPSPAL